MLTSISNFGNNAAGLEKTLRLAQALSQIGASLAVEAADAKTWVLARGEFNLARRFFRLHKWIDHWSLAQDKFNAQNDDAVVKLLDVTKNGFLGIYFFLEMGTITNVMGVTATTWGPQLAHESAKFWFYGIVTSILLSLYQVFFTVTPTRTTGKAAAPSAIDEKASPTEKTSPTPTQTQTDTRSTEIYRQLLIDGCDLFIPGSTVGWTPFEPLTIGIFMSISSVLAMGSMWPKVQASAAAAAAKKK